MSNRIEHNKLVGDKILEIIRTSGNQFEIITLDNAEYIKALKQKLVEEAQETAIAKLEDLTQELADVLKDTAPHMMEVIDALMTATGIEPEKVREIQQEKRCLRLTS